MHLSNSERNPNAPLRLLSLDGGGVRGLSSLLVLDTLMENIALEEKRLGRRAMNDHEPLKPCDYFDLIGGTSTGGIIAIMLSRLRLDCKQCIAVYSRLAEQIFKHDRSISVLGMKVPTGATRFSGAVLANAVKTALKDLGFDPDELMWDEELFEEVEDELPPDSIWADAPPKVTLTESPVATMKNSLASLESGPPLSAGDAKPWSTLYSTSPFDPKPLTRKSTWKPHKRTSVHRKANKKGCRGFVLTSLKNALGLPRILSTYDPNDRTTRIWEALRATSAAPTFFEEMQFGIPKVTYLDGGVGFNNPCAEVDYAAKAVWENRSIGVILSVGTGLQSIPSVKTIASWLPFGLGTDISIASALTGMATSTARVDNEMKRMYSNSDTKYFRFDVDRGLADISLEQWMKEDEMASLTELYMSDGQQIRAARDFGELMANLSALPPKFEIAATAFAVGMSKSHKLDDSFKLVHVDFKSGMPMGVGLTTSKHYRTGSSPTGEGGLAIDETGRLRKIYPVAADLDFDGRREEAAVYQCISAKNICLRSIKTGIPQGRYKVSFVIAFHDASFSPPHDLIFSVGKPFDSQTFTSRYVDVKITPDVASVLLHPDAVRVRVGSRRYEEFRGKGWVEIQGDSEVSVGLDGALGFLVSKRYENGVAIDGWSFGGVRLEPVFGSSGAIARQVELGKLDLPVKTPEDLTLALERRDSSAVRDLVEREFETVAKEKYEWLNELVDVGYNRDDIVDLLLEEAKDAPWIYCDTKDQSAGKPELSVEIPNDDSEAYNIWRHPRGDIKNSVTSNSRLPAETSEGSKEIASPDDQVSYYFPPVPQSSEYMGTGSVQTYAKYASFSPKLVKNLGRLSNRQSITNIAPSGFNTDPQIDKEELVTQNAQLPAETSKNSKGFPYSNPPWMSKRHDIKKLVQRLCGLGGIAPTSRTLADWNGEVVFEDNYSTSYITYAIPSLYNGNIRPSMVISRLKRVLKGFCEAAAALQSAGLCLDEFTIAHIPVDPNISTCNVQLARVRVSLANRLYEALDQLSFEDLDLMSLESSAAFLDHTHARWISENILTPLMNGDSKQPILELMYENTLHICCLAAQFLCIGLVSFCQGHIGPIESVFTNHTQERSVLLGVHTLDSTVDIFHPYIAVRLSKLTCLSEMTEGPLITFSLITKRPEEDSELQRNVREASLDKKATTKSRLGLGNVFADEKTYNVEAMPQDILDTWGPGQLVPCEDSEMWLDAIHVGGGVIYYQYEFGRRLHWAAGSVPKHSPGRSFPRGKRIIVGAPVTENSLQCSFPWETWRKSCPLVHLAVRPEGWIVNQRQLGLQVGPDHAALQAMQVWSKVPGKLLKEYQLSQGDLGLMEFLGCYVGVQMSCCTGVARRIPLQELLSDLMPKFCITHMGETDWNDWNTKHNIVAGLRRTDVRDWLCTLRRDSADAYNTLLAHVHRILNVLEPTGLNRERTHMKLAWPKEGDLHRGLKVSCQAKHLWAQTLVDSEEGVTFAYMTSTCLLCEGNSCQQQQPSWRMAPKCLGTAVTQYRNEVEEEDLSSTAIAPPLTPNTPWTLQIGQSYHMWNEKRCIRLHAASYAQQQQTGQYRLMASESTIPKYFATRHFRSKRAKKNLLRERHHPEDAAVDVLIVDRE